MRIKHVSVLCVLSLMKYVLQPLLLSSPIRFLFILLGPKGKAKSYHEIGRAIATLMSDEVGNREDGDL